MTGVALAYCILGKFLGVVCHCFPPPLDLPTFAARCLYVRNDARNPSSERWNCGRDRCPVILPKFRLPRKFRALFHAVNLRHGTDGFTSPPKEGVFFVLKIRRLRPGFNPRTWVLKASTLPLDHRSRCFTFYTITIQMFCFSSSLITANRKSENQSFENIVQFISQVIPLFQHRKL